jgi:putative intracellular protease/amidase
LVEVFDPDRATGEAPGLGAWWTQDACCLRAHVGSVGALRTPGHRHRNPFRKRVDIPFPAWSFEVNHACPMTRLRDTVLMAVFTVAAFNASTAAAAAPQPVLMVIANQDFHYAEYAAARAALEARGLTVAVAAGEARLAQPQGTGVGSPVRPDLTLSMASANRYSAIVFVGGWGASSYQYAFSGTYLNTAYRPQRATVKEVNRLINEFTIESKPVAAVCHGVTVLAWARVDGVSPLNGRIVVGPAGGTPAFRLGGTSYPDAEQPARWQVEHNGATMLTARSVGNPMSATDDVWVDGKIITAENFDAIARLGELLAQSVATNRD